MKTISVSNFRCFEHTGDIEIKPLTVLVGANSSGKSSFIKLFPLLKQSIGRQHEGVFIWYDPSGVDFNNMPSVLRRGQKSMDLKLTFEKVIFRNFFNRKQPKTSNISVSLRFSLDKNNNEKIDYFEITLFDYNIKIKFLKNEKVSFLINDKKVGVNDDIKIVMQDSLLPRFVFRSEDSNDLSFSHPFSLQNDIKNNFLVSHKDSNTHPSDMSKWMNWLPGGVESLSSCLGIEHFPMQRKERAIRQYIVNNINDLIDTINRYIIFMTRNITYIGPLRVMTERYNRETNHSIDEISPNGENLASLLSSLSKEKLTEFKKWTADNLGFIPHVSKKDGIIELAVAQEGSDEFYNLSDLGVGYTQILPILVGIWQAQEDKMKNILTRSVIYKKERIICIEQPELHIHPKMQKRFVDLLINILSNQYTKYQFKFIIETHSQTIISAIGEAVRNNTLNKDSVSILLFEKKKNDPASLTNDNVAPNTDNRRKIKSQFSTKITPSKFNEKGYLTQWPYGFLS